MTVALVAGVDPARPKRRGLPGLGLIASTHGLQRVMLLIGVVLVAGFVLVGLAAPLIAPYGFAQLFSGQLPPSGDHLLGTTVGGYDVFSRIVWGCRTAVEVIVLAISLSTLVGVPLGLLSGYLGGPLDRVLVLIMDALYAFPSLLLAIVVSITISGGQAGVLGGIVSAAVSITVVFIPQYFRVIRNATIQVKVEPYVEAAKVAGASPLRIMFGHVLANVSQSIPVLTTLNASESILTLASLGFLGFGIEPTSAAEWGYDLNKAMSDVANGIWWTGLFPGLAIVLIVTGVTLIGESLNDVLNPLLRTRGGAATADERELVAVVEAAAGARAEAAVGSAVDAGAVVSGEAGAVVGVGGAQSADETGGAVVSGEAGAGGVVEAGGLGTEAAAGTAGANITSESAVQAGGAQSVDETDGTKDAGAEAAADDDGARR
ncbi:MAG: ABC transporter permease [Propionibacteriaceae bacterium]|jgi:peptide/nickel transport system permease protein|nr:ABC transporter permease [Propionibacteriaceae bacterium]